MNGSSHEFFAERVAPDGVLPLSDYFEDRLWQENDAMRDSSVPDYFVIPQHLLELTPHTTTVINVTGNHHLRIPPEQSVCYSPNQVRLLNTIFRAGRFVTAQEIVEEINERSSVPAKRQLQFVDDLYNRKLSNIGGFLVRQERNGEFAYAVDPKTAFNDRRGESQMPEEQHRRQQILSAICTRFGNDPAMLKQLTRHYMCPLEQIPRGWRAHALARYQIKDFEIISPDAQQKMIDELDDLVEASANNQATDEDQLRAAVLCNQLIYSYLGLGNAVAFSTLGRGFKTVKSSVRGLMAYFPDNSMDKPEDDVYAMAGMGVVTAIQTYDKKRGGLANHVITQVANTIRDGILDDRRHMYGKTHLEMEKEGAVRGVKRRVLVRPELGHRTAPPDLPEPRTSFIDTAYESLLREINVVPFVRAVFRDKRLRSAEKLILSLTQGIYNEEFEGKVLRGANGQTFVYDTSFRQNPLFREGMSDREVSRMFDVSVSQIARLRESALRKVGSLMGSSLIIKHNKDKLAEWLW